MINPEVPDKVDVEQLDAPDLIEKAESLLAKVEEKTGAIEEKLTALDAEKNDLTNALNVANKLKSFDIDFSDIKDSNYISTKAGKMPTPAFEEFKKEVDTVTDKVVISEYTEDNITTIILVTLNEFNSEISSLLRKYEFEMYDISGLSNKPDAIIRNSESRINEIENERNNSMNNLADIAEKWKTDLLVLKEQLEIEKDRNEIFSAFGETEKTLMLEAWVPEKKLNRALEIIENSSEGHAIVEVLDPQDGDDIPVQLDNPRFAKPYQLFVEMYSSPSYKEVDPTILVALVFPFFFGFCLTDAGYGIAVMLVGVALMYGIGKVNKTMRSLGVILVACGAWAVILGLVTNSLLGNFYPWLFLGNPFGGSLPTTIEAVNSFAAPQNILVMALIVGVIYTVVGLLIGTYNNLVIGQVKEALGEQVVWLIMLLGVGLLAASFLFNIGSIYIGGAVMGIAFIMLIAINKLFGLLDISGFLGTLLSYARLLALALATGGIAMTVNILTGLIGDMVPYIGFLLAPVIFVLGHIANGAFQVLGGFINALRLHYVEFFSQFYIGGSSKFRAFRTKRKLTRLGGK
jgi:V/A-type H+-transporting ATPase subunit I